MDRDVTAGPIAAVCGWKAYEGVRQIAGEDHSAGDDGYRPPGRCAGVVPHFRAGAGLKRVQDAVAPGT